jgi:hypothetical protein
LLFENLKNGAILRGAKFVQRYATRGMSGSGLQQFRRPQEAAYVLSAIGCGHWRFSPY